MAKPITLEKVQQDPRIELQARLENAPAEHAEAILSGLDVLQGLHDCGILDLIRGALGSSEKVLEIAVDAAKTPTSIRAMRNLIQLVNLIGEIDPDQLRTLTRTIPQALKSIEPVTAPPSLWRLTMDLLGNSDSRRGLAAANKILQTLGQELADSHPAEGRTT